MQALIDELTRAREVYRENKDAGAPAESLAYDAGIIEGLKRAVEIMEGIK